MKNKTYIKGFDKDFIEAMRKDFVAHGLTIDEADRVYNLAQKFALKKEKENA